MRQEGERESSIFDGMLIEFLKVSKHKAGEVQGSGEREGFRPHTS